MQVQHDSFNSRLGFHPRGFRIQLETKQKHKKKDQVTPDGATSMDFFFSFCSWEEGKGKKGTFAVLAVATLGFTDARVPAPRTAPRLAFWSWLQKINTPGRMVDLCRLQLGEIANPYFQCLACDGEWHTEPGTETGRTFMAICEYCLYFILTSKSNLKRRVHTTTHEKELLWFFYFFFRNVKS